MGAACSRPIYPTIPHRIKRPPDQKFTHSDPAGRSVSAWPFAAWSIFFSEQTSQSFCLTLCSQPFCFAVARIFLTVLRAQSEHGDASAESSITSLLVVRGSPRRWRLLMDGSISSFPFCEYPYYTRKRGKKLLLFSGRRRTQNGRLFAARIVIQLRYSRSRSRTMRTYFVLHPARSPACNAL